MSIKNTPAFWDKTLENSKSKIVLSPIYRAKNKTILNLVKGLLPPAILDIGAGYGHFEELVIKNQLPIKLFGTDFAIKAVKDLKNRFGLGFKKSKLPNIPFPGNKFECVLLLDVIEHIPKSLTQKCYTEINRVLKNRGYLIVSVPINENKADTIRNMHHRKYTENSIANELKNNGYNVLQTKTFFAFKSFFVLKNLLMKVRLVKGRRKPNLAIILAQKK